MFANAGRNLDPRGDLRCTDDGNVFLEYSSAEGKTFHSIDGDRYVKFDEACRWVAKPGRPDSGDFPSSRPITMMFDVGQEFEDDDDLPCKCPDCITRLLEDISDSSAPSSTSSSPSRSPINWSKSATSSSSLAVYSRSESSATSVVSEMEVYHPVLDARLCQSTGSTRGRDGNPAGNPFTPLWCFLFKETSSNSNVYRCIGIQYAMVGLRCQRKRQNISTKNAIMIGVIKNDAAAAAAGSNPSSVVPINSNCSETSVKFYLGTDTNRLVPLKNVTILSADGGTLTQQQSVWDAQNWLMSGECHDVQHVSPTRADCSEDDLINTNTNAIGPRNDSLCSISHERFVADRIFPGGYFVLSPLPTPRLSPARDMTTDDVIVDEIQVDERFHVVEDTSKRHVDCTSESQLSSSSSCDDVVGDMDEGSSADEMSEIDHQSPGSEFGSCSSDVHLDSDLAFERDVAEFLRQNFPNGNFQVIGDAGENEVLYEISFDDAKEADGCLNRIANETVDAGNFHQQNNNSGGGDDDTGSVVSTGSQCSLCIVNEELKLRLAEACRNLEGAEKEVEDLKQKMNEERKREDEIKEELVRKTDEERNLAAEEIEKLKLLANEDKIDMNSKIDDLRKKLCKVEAEFEEERGRWKQVLNVEREQAGNEILNLKEELKKEKINAETEIARLERKLFEEKSEMKKNVEELQEKLEEARDVNISKISELESVICEEQKRRIDKVRELKDEMNEEKHRTDLEIRKWERIMHEEEDTRVKVVGEQEEKLSLERNAAETKINNLELKVREERKRRKTEVAELQKILTEGRNERDIEMGELKRIVREKRFQWTKEAGDLDDKFCGEKNVVDFWVEVLEQVNKREEEVGEMQTKLLQEKENARVEMEKLMALMEKERMGMKDELAGLKEELSSERDRTEERIRKLYMRMKAKQHRTDAEVGLLKETIKKERVLYMNERLELVRRHEEASKALENELQAAGKQIEELMKTVVETSMFVEELKKELSVQMEMNEKLKIENIEKLKLKIEAECRIEELRELLKTKLDVVKEHDLEREELRDRLRSFEDTVTELVNEKEEITARLEEMKRDVVEGRKREEELVNKCAGKIEEINQLRKDLAEEKSSRELERKEMLKNQEATCEELEKQLKNACERTKELERREPATRLMINCLARKCELSKKRVAHLEDLLQREQQVTKSMERKFAKELHSAKHETELLAEELRKMKDKIPELIDRESQTYENPEDVKKIQMHLEMANTKISMLEKELEGAEMRNENLKLRMEEENKLATLKRNRLKRELELERKKSYEIENTVEEKRNTESSLRKMQSDHEEKCVELQAMIKRLEDRIKEAVDSENKQQEIEKKKNSVIKDYEKRISELEERMREASGQAFTRELELHRQVNILQVAKDELKRRTDLEKQEHKVEMENADGAIRVMETELNALRGYVEILKANNRVPRKDDRLNNDKFDDYTNQLLLTKFKVLVDDWHRGVEGLGGKD